MVWFRSCSENLSTLLYELEPWHHTRLTLIMQVIGFLGWMLTLRCIVYNEQNVSIRPYITHPMLNWIVLDLKDFSVCLILCIYNLCTEQHIKASRSQELYGKVYPLYVCVCALCTVHSTECISTFTITSDSSLAIILACSIPLHVDISFALAWLQCQTMKYAEELSLYITINFTAMKSRLLSKWNMITCHNETKRLSILTALLDRLDA